MNGILIQMYYISIPNLTEQSWTMSWVGNREEENLYVDALAKGADVFVLATKERVERFLAVKASAQSKKLLLNYFPETHLYFMCLFVSCCIANFPRKLQYYHVYIFQMTLLFLLSMLMLEYNYMAILIWYDMTLLFLLSMLMLEYNYMAILIWYDMTLLFL